MHVEESNHTCAAPRREGEGGGLALGLFSFFLSRGRRDTNGYGGQILDEVQPLKGRVKSVLCASVSNRMLHFRETDNSQAERGLPFPILHHVHFLLLWLLLAIIRVG